MEPWFFETAVDTPSEPFSACPPGAFQTLSLPKVQSEPAVAARYLVKLSVVPDESDRWIARIGADGRVAFGLSPLMAGSSQVLTVPAKIFASVDGLNCRSLAPVTL